MCILKRCVELGRSYVNCRQYHVKTLLRWHEKRKVHCLAISLIRSKQIFNLIYCAVWCALFTNFHQLCIAHCHLWHSCLLYICAGMWQWAWGCFAVRCERKGVWRNRFWWVSMLAWFFCLDLARFIASIVEIIHLHINRLRRGLQSLDFIVVSFY